MSHKVDFPHTATTVAPDSPQGTRWANRAPMRAFTFWGRWAKIAKLRRRGRRPRQFGRLLRCGAGGARGCGRCKNSNVPAASVLHPRAVPRRRENA